MNSTQDRLKLRKRNSVVAWGCNDAGQLGNGRACQCNSTPTEVSLSFKVRQVSAGLRHTAFLTEDGNLYTCGYNEFGQLGVGSSRTKIKTPHKLPFFKGNCKSISCGGFHTLAIDENQRLYAWGRNNHGQLGLSATNQTTRLSPTLVKSLSNSQVKSVHSGRCHNFAVIAPTSVCQSKLVSWGSNDHGQLGVGDNRDRKSPTEVQVLTRSSAEISNVFVGPASNHSFFLTKSGILFGCGNNTHGQLGNGHKVNQYVPVQIQINRIQNIAVGWMHTVMLTSNNLLYLCGRDYQIVSPHPTPMKDFKAGCPIKHIAAGTRHSTILTDDGTIYSWGLNSYGQLGSGTKQTRRKANACSVGDKKITGLACGGGFTLVFSARTNPDQFKADLKAMMFPSNLGFSNNCMRMSTA